MFKRKISKINEKYMRSAYSHVINTDTIETLNRKKIKIYLKEDEDLMEPFLHLIVNEWVLENDITVEKLPKLRKIIKRLGLKLNEIEEHNLFLLEERAFGSIRAFKILEVNSNLEKDEEVNIKYDGGEFFVLEENKYKLLKRAPLLVSNFRIMSEDIDGSPVSFWWTLITDIEFLDYGFSFVSKNKKYLVRIHDQDTLNRTLKSFLPKKTQFLDQGN